MKIFLTGCAGFIGSRTGELLLQQGHEIVGVDNMNDYYDEGVKRHRLQSLMGHEGFRFEALDIEDLGGLEKLFKSDKFDAVINLAARAGVRASIDDPLVYLRTNTEGTLNLLRLMVDHGVRKLVTASTSSLYAGAPMPFVETADVTRPLSPYAASKLGSEVMASVWNHLHGIDVAVLRYFTVFGPAGRPDMSIFRFIERIRRGNPVPLTGDGTQTRDFTYVDDIARGTIAALGTNGYEIFNLGGGNEPWSINAMIELFERLLGKDAVIETLPTNSADMKNTAADISKAESLLGWQPEISPAEGFERTVHWHQANSDWLDKIDF